MADEELFEVFWDGPYDCNEDNICAEEKAKVLYQIYGSHHLYGRDVLLYIGRTERAPFKKKNLWACNIVIVDRSPEVRLDY